MAIQHLKAINEELTEAQLDYLKRPTVDEKKSWLLLQMKEAKHELNHAEVLVEKLKRDYEIEKLNIRFTGDFLSSVATGAGLE